MNEIIFYYDLETTGLNPYKCCIHQLAGCIEVNGVVKEYFNIKMQPHENARIEQTALDVCNVTLEQIKAYPTRKQAYDKLIATLDKYVNKYDSADKMYLSGYNIAAFDNHFLSNFFLQMGNKFFGSYFFAGSLDIFVLATLYLKGEERAKMITMQLKDVAEKLGVEVDSDELHDAMYDMKLTRATYKKIQNQLLLFSLF